MGVVAILLQILQQVPDARVAFNRIKETLSTHDQQELEDQLAKVRGERKEADDALDAVLRERGI